MRIITLFILLIVISSCDRNNKANKSKEESNVEIIVGEEKSELGIVMGNDSFKNDEAKSLNNLGINYIREKQYKKAEEYFLAAFRLEPKNPTILNNLGNIYREIGTDKMALEYYTKSFIASDSTYFNAAYNMGIAYCNLEEYEKSLEVLEYIIAVSKDKNEKLFAEYVIIRVYLSQNQCSKAKQLYDRIKTGLDKFPEFKENRAELEERMENCVQHRLSAIAPARLPGKSHGFSYRSDFFGNLVAKPRHGS